jgi:hypothetical protein
MNHHFRVVIQRSSEPAIHDEVEPNDPMHARRGSVFGFLNDGDFGEAEISIQ